MELAAPAIVEERQAACEDHRFRDLVGPKAWARLAPRVRARFSKVLKGGSAVYVGQVTQMHATAAGKALSIAARLIGGPLPLVWEAPSPSIVAVTEDGAGGQNWTRTYARRLGFPQVVHSAKRFEGPTGLEEHVGGGVGMALNVSVDEGDLVFRSAFYFVAMGRLRIRIPRLLEPGRISVVHHEIGEGRFSFTLEVRHPLLGLMLRQHAIFREENP